MYMAVIWVTVMTVYMYVFAGEDWNTVSICTLQERMVVILSRGHKAGKEKHVHKRITWFPVPGINSLQSSKVEN